VPVWRIEDSLNLKMDEVHFKTEGLFPMSQEALPEGRGLRKPKGFRLTPPRKGGVIHLFYHNIN